MLSYLPKPAYHIYIVLILSIVWFLLKKTSWKYCTVVLWHLGVKMIEPWDFVITVVVQSSFHPFQGRCTAMGGSILLNMP
jgi:hypothetical protein